MIWSDGIFLALRAITAHRLRSFLTLLGIAVGIAAVILLTSIGEGIHRFVLAEFTQFGTNVIGIAPGRVKTARRTAVGTADCRAASDLRRCARAAARLPHVIGVAPTVWGNSEVAGNGRLRRTTVYGVSAAALQVFNMSVKSGQFLPDEEWESARAFVVLGKQAEGRTFRLRPIRSVRGCASARCSSA